MEDSSYAVFKNVDNIIIPERSHKAQYSSLVAIKNRMRCTYNRRLQIVVSARSFLIFQNGFASFTMRFLDESNRDLIINESQTVLYSTIVTFDKLATIFYFPAKIFPTISTII
jgi:hypothetical protein